MCQHCSKCFTNISLFNPHKDSMSSYCPYPIIQMERQNCIEAKLMPQSHVAKLGDLGFISRLSCECVVCECAGK